MIRAISAAIIACAVSTSPAASESVTNAEFVEKCKAAPNTPERGYCTGYIRGVTIGIRNYTILHARRENARRHNRATPENENAAIRHLQHEQERADIFCWQYTTDIDDVTEQVRKIITTSSVPKVWGPPPLIFKTLVRLYPCYKNQFPEPE